MSIRVKREQICTTLSQGAQRCWYENIPIREWALSPEIINLNWKNGDTIPTSQLITIVFPDVEELSEYQDIKDFTYGISAPEEGESFFSLSHNYSNINNLTLPKDGKIQFRIIFSDFAHLPPGNSTKKIICSIYTKTADSVRTLEHRELSVTVSKQGEVAIPTIAPDKSSYYITYDKNTDKYTGDVDIRFLYTGLSEYWDKITYVGMVSVETPLTPTFGIGTNGTHTFGGFTNVDTMNLGDYIFKYKAVLKKNSYAPDSAGAIVSESSVFPIYFKITDSTSGLKVSKKNFEFVLKKEENKTAQGHIYIRKNSNATLTIQPSAILSVERQPTSDESSLSIDFISLPAQQLKIGKNKGSILIESSEGNIALISVLITVTEDISYKNTDVLFCLDSNPLQIRQTNELSEFVKLNMTMQFQGYGHSKYSIEQSYEYVFYQGSITAYPGEEVQDFFMEVNDVEILKNTGYSFLTRYLFHSAVVTIDIVEYGKDGTIYKESKLDNLQYLPGKKPLAFPYLTNAKVRTTYAESLISLSALGISVKSENLGNITGGNIDTTTIQDDFDVVNICFRRIVSNKDTQEILTNKYLSIEPIPTPKNQVDVLFINQNLCPDWFSFSGEWEQNAELEHIISNKTRRGNLFKAKVNAKNILKLNTGWMFEEEVILLEELIKSPYCFVKRKEEWLRCIPISKKPISYDTERNVNSQIVKFQIVKDDER